MLNKLLITLIANSLALFVTARLVSDFQIEGGMGAYVLLALWLTIFNAILRPFLNLLSLPLIFLTGGLFLIVINAVILKLSGHFFTVMDIQGFKILVQSPLTYLLAAVILGVANWLIHWFLKDE